MMVVIKSDVLIDTLKENSSTSFEDVLCVLYIRDQPSGNETYELCVVLLMGLLRIALSPRYVLIIDTKGL